MSSKPIAVSQRLARAIPSNRTLPWATSFSLFLGDLAALSGVYWLVVIGRHLVGPGYELTFYLEFFPCFGVLFGAFLAQGLYPGILLHRAEELRRIFYAVCFCFMLIMSTTFLWRNAEEYSRSVVLLVWALTSPAIMLARAAIRRKLSHRQWWGISAIVFGSGMTARRVLRTLRSGSMGIKVLGVFTDDEDSRRVDWELQPVLGSIRSAAHSTWDHSAHYAILALSDKTSTELRHAIQDHCRGFRNILLVPNLPGICSMGISACEIGGELGFEVPQRLFHRRSALAKRTIDIVVGTTAILALTPVLIAIATAIKLTSPGPVLYGQNRYGRNGMVFKALKFRTMVVNAEEVLSHSLLANPLLLAEWQRDHKLKNDPRVTRIGRWLRRSSLDELPQLLNVLTGQMSLVGPRPIVAAEIPKYGRGYSLYTRVLPGITGLWQVSGRNNTTYEERVAFDEYYVHNWSVWLDGYILFRTIKTVLTGDGAY